MDMVTMMDVSKSFGKRQILKNVNLNVKSGEVVVIRGANGSGKTTLFKLILGFKRATSGTIEVATTMVRKEHMFATKTGFFIKEYGSLPSKTGFANMQLVAHLIDKHYPDKQLVDLLTLVDLDPNNRLKVKDYSMGMQQRLGLAISLIGNPELLVWDEPSNALDHDGQMMLQRLMAKLKQQGVTIILSNHSTPLPETLVDHVFWINDSSLVESEQPLS